MLDTGGEGALSTQVELDVYAFHLIGREVFAAPPAPVSMKGDDGSAAVVTTIGDDA